MKKLKIKMIRGSNVKMRRGTIVQSGSDLRDRSQSSNERYNAALREILLAKDEGARVYQMRSEHAVKVMSRFEGGRENPSAKFYEGYSAELRHVLESKSHIK